MSDPIYGESLTSPDTFDLTAQDDDLSTAAAGRALAGSRPTVTGARAIRAFRGDKSERGLHLALAMVIEPDAAGLTPRHRFGRRNRGW